MGKHGTRAATAKDLGQEPDHSHELVHDFHKSPKLLTQKQLDRQIRGQQRELLEKASEWPEVQQKLQQSVNAKGGTTYHQPRKPPSKAKARLADKLEQRKQDQQGSGSTSKSAGEAEHGYVSGSHRQEMRGSSEQGTSAEGRGKQESVSASDGSPIRGANEQGTPFEEKEKQKAKKKEYNRRRKERKAREQQQQQQGESSSLGRAPSRGSKKSDSTSIFADPEAGPPS